MHGKHYQIIKDNNMRGRGHIFDDLGRLNEMLTLRLRGAGPSSLAQHYGCDHTTIIYHCKRAGVQVSGQRGVLIITSGFLSVGPIQQVLKEKPKPVPKPVLPIQRYDDDGSKINPGKSYAEYVAIANQRREKERMEMIKNNTLNKKNE